ncbi:purine-nucleoside phosphorylase [Cryobacterium sp. MP_M5]|uniref:purine-nucleoside phosphorylase n=1 Tax=unclassified Cryobacterium TaxID=2649013 RepID=UPI0018CA302B|nr:MULTISPECIES: purine-nucleoside phosphorylase [unclassified Cryobacterium]MBG6058039.1 purine-nucleoside phosphorylase [Cryobacterium sp. MP_M3]MEC5176238.1 purine-nucleoside phosphorylase [Cryobacterium sp. MP_M5]
MSSTTTRVGSQSTTKGLYPTTRSTPHIDPKGVDIAETILLPGDPLRAKFIAETYFDDIRCFNTVRNMLGFTGTYRGRPVSVMGTGMGIPSISLYSYELIHFFGVKNLIRVGSCGAMQEKMELYDVVIAQGASTDSNYLQQFNLPGSWAPLSSYRLLEHAKRIADERGQRTHVGNVLSSDLFYGADPDAMGKWMKMGVLAAEMESAGLFANAAAGGVDALGIFTVSDQLVTGAKTTPEERQTAFTGMIEIALELI